MRLVRAPTSDAHTQPAQPLPPQFRHIAILLGRQGGAATGFRTQPSRRARLPASHNPGQRSAWRGQDSATQRDRGQSPHTRLDHLARLPQQRHDLRVGRDNHPHRYRQHRATPRAQTLRRLPHRRRQLSHGGSLASRGAPQCAHTHYPSTRALRRHHGRWHPHHPRRVAVRRPRPAPPPSHGSPGPHA